MSQRKRIVGNTAETQFGRERAFAFGLALKRILQVDGDLPRHAVALWQKQTNLSSPI